ncbi:MAG: hypothetical protein JWM59_613 [Verrucomicrobiales bacterium]|nr:hypothetical protein [Verrucomicrobiales bacterium]
MPVSPVTGKWTNQTITNINIIRMKHTRASVAACLSAVALTTAAAFAGTPEPVTTGKTVVLPPTAPAPSDAVTGTLGLNYNTHFISYGQDIWQAGTDFGDNATFNPSFELNFDLSHGFKAILGTWWDVNKNAPSNIGDDVIQEIDVWGGFSYTVNKWSFSLLYQEWMYASQSERIVDFKIAYADGLLNPSLLLHGRVDGAEPFDTGLVTVLGIAPGTKAGPLTLTFPIQVAADTDGFHGGDGGFSFASAGVTASVPLKFMPGDWALNAGLIYYHTEKSVFPTNPDSDFLTGTIGLGLTF